VQFRDFLCDQDYKAPTVNKKVGHITTLLATAQKAGWIDTAISGGIYIEIPAGTNEREPFSAAELDAIFSDDVFCKGKRSTNPKAGGELEFWIPLISLASGLISSEILQLGPDTALSTALRRRDDELGPNSAFDSPCSPCSPFRRRVLSGAAILSFRWRDSASCW
jgi:hypothetical protein